MVAGVTALVLAAAPAPAVAQSAFVAPQAGWSEFRRLVLGARAGVELLRGLELTGEALTFFPEEEFPGASPRAHVDRDAWQLNTALLYAPDPGRRLVPYGGVGASWATNRRSVVVDGVRSRIALTGWAVNLALGVRLPRPGLEPFVEWRTEMTRESQWVVTGGARIRVGS